MELAHFGQRKNFKKRTLAGGGSGGVPIKTGPKARSRSGASFVEEKAPSPSTTGVTRNEYHPCNAASRVAGSSTRPRGPHRWNRLVTWRRPLRAPARTALWPRTATCTARNRHVHSDTLSPHVASRGSDHAPATLVGRALASVFACCAPRASTSQHVQGFPCRSH
jgi:hypothetical protein